MEEEYAELQRTGYAGEGFHSPGVRLGAGVSHNVPPHLARQKALEAAEKRRKIAAVMRGGGRLGGGMRDKSPRELAAEVRMTFESLVHDLNANVGCRETVPG